LSDAAFAAPANSQELQGKVPWRTLISSPGPVEKVPQPVAVDQKHVKRSREIRGSAITAAFGAW
jgi:hypothetical protein